MEDKYKKAIHEFYAAYEELKQYGNYRLHTHSSIYPKDDALIEIYTYSGREQQNRVLKVTQEDETDAYMQAADQIRSMLQSLKREAKERRRAV